MLLATPAPAKLDDRAVLSAYARARAADQLGSAGTAAKAYSTIVAIDPENPLVASRMLAQAVQAGEWPLALDAARRLDAARQLGLDGRLLLVSDALRNRRWKEARAEVERIDRETLFGFLAPLLNAWIDVGMGKGDPIARLDAAKDDPLGSAYAAEQRPLLLLASGHTKAAIAEIEKAAVKADRRALRLQLAAAATLAGKGKRKQALAVLAGDKLQLVAARRLLAERKPIAGAISDAAAGAGELFVRVAVDLQQQDVPQIALTMARLGTYLAPENAEAWLVAAQLLEDRDRTGEALVALDRIGAEDPLSATMMDEKVQMLVASGKKDAALEEARGRAERKGAGAADWARLGDVYLETERYREAADAYARSIEKASSGDAARALWVLWLLHGSALEQDEQWPAAKHSLEMAYRLEPKEPIVLNYLGYAQLERRENVEAAMALVQEASRLQPDSAEITDSLGWAHFLRGETAKAIELLERAAAAEPSDPEIIEHLGDAYYRAGRHYEARYAWAAALVHAGDRESERLRGKIDLGLGGEPEAR